MQSKIIRLFNNLAGTLLLMMSMVLFLRNSILMKNKYKVLIVSIALTILSTATLFAENAVVLESFEANIYSASLMTNFGGRPLLDPPGVALSQYSKQDALDANVTEGNKSLKIVLSGKDKFSGDFQIKFTKEASDKIRAAAASSDIARYILRYDVIFPPSNDFVYFNSVLYFGDSQTGLISSGGKRSVSIALDLITGLPMHGRIALVIANDFQSKHPFKSATIYIDNIRLVDTYAPGAKPATYVLQSFENSDNPIGGATNFEHRGSGTSRTTYANYTAVGTNDIQVTEGKHALEVDFTNPGIWHPDFIIPFYNTKLAEVLKLDAPDKERPTREQLARYTLRWDIIYPDMTDGEWINSTYNTLAAYLPMIQTKATTSKNRGLTYSVTLDQTDWDDQVPGHPVLAFITQGPQVAHTTKIYYDNFRLIDTGDVFRSSTGQ